MACPEKIDVHVTVGPIKNRYLFNENGSLPEISQGKDLEIKMGAALDEDGIPAELQGRQFPDIDALYDELEILGLPDYKLLLDSVGFVTMRDPKHHRGIRFIEAKLATYSKAWFGDWGCVSTNNVQQINRVTATGRTAKREPDVNFWHHRKCAGLTAARQRACSSFDLDPDVFFQFSLGNTLANEFDVMNELLTLGCVGVGNTGPRIGCFVKVRRVGGSNVGIDAYKVYNGRTVADAIAQAHDCTHTYYNHAAGSDVVIEIPAADFRFRDFRESLYPSFKLSVQK